MRGTAFALLVTVAGCGTAVPPEVPAGWRYVTVGTGQKIQDAIDAAGNGTWIDVAPGTYAESLNIPKERALTNLTLRGLVSGSSRAVLDGGGTLQNGLFAAAVTGFTIEGFQVQNYRENGVWVGQSQGLTFRDLVVDHTGKYGIFPVESQDILVEKSLVTHVADAAIYVGQSTGDIVVQDNEVHDNVAGIECENSLDCNIRRNKSHDNTGGILVFVLPHLARKDNRRARVYDNDVENNNTANFAAPSDIVANVPPGGGVTIIGADDVAVHDNVIKGNASYGVAIVDLTLLTGTSPIDVEPTPDDCMIQDNMLVGNGTTSMFTFMGITLPAGDLGWDGSGTGNCQSNNGVAMPRWVLSPLPTCN